MNPAKKIMTTVMIMMMPPWVKERTSWPPSIHQNESIAVHASSSCITAAAV